MRWFFSFFALVKCGATHTRVNKIYEVTESFNIQSKNIERETPIAQAHCIFRDLEVIAFFVSINCQFYFLLCWFQFQCITLFMRSMQLWHFVYKYDAFQKKKMIGNKFPRICTFHCIQIYWFYLKYIFSDYSYQSTLVFTQLICFALPTFFLI